MRTGFVFSERYLWHETNSQADLSEWVQPSLPAEGPEAKRRIRNLLDVTGMLDRLVKVDPRPATREEIERFHLPAYIDSVKAGSDAFGGNAGPAAPFGHRSYEIALLAAGGTIAAADAVLDGTVDNVYALVRPPGHHAEPGEGNGFCLFNNIGVAIHHARQVRGVERIAVVDWDVHHGNGTEAGFLADGRTLTISMHQDGLWPYDSGKLADNGVGPGAGANLNIPLPAGSGEGAYLAAFDRVVLPALDRFRPDMIFVACGFDANYQDPLARMMLDSETFRAMTSRVVDAADRLCGGRLVVSHEGGYSDVVVPFCGLAMVEEMSGVSSGVRDPWVPGNRLVPGQELAPHQEAAVTAAVPLVERVPTPA